MRKILISLAIIGAVSAIVVGATTAFFSDTETSSGNTFTAGAIDLKVDNHCYYNDRECICATSGEHAGKCYWDIGGNGHFGDGEVSEDNRCYCTWDEKDLEDGDLFFYFTDLKPGDHGEDTISLHVHDNDAWACVTVKDLKDDDNGCTEPEGEDGDSTCGENEGELSQHLYFFAWADNDGDNVYEPGEGERYLFTNIFGPASDVLNGRTYPLADSTVNVFTGSTSGDEPLIGCDVYYIGLAWCFGTMTVNTQNGQITCSGAGNHNITQTDSLTGTIEFYTEQARNNSTFVCQQL